MKCLVFTTNIYGHFVEYIHHLCVAAAETNDRQLYIYVPSTFLEKKELLSWPDTKKIHFDYYEEAEVDTGNYFRDSYNAARILGKKTKEIRPDSILLLAMMQVMPFVVFFVPWRIKVSGIIYNIYLYKWKKESFVRKVEDAVKYLLFSKCPLFGSVFILNDSVSAKILNRIWRTDRFIYLPDPCPNLISEKLQNIRSVLNIPEGKKVFLHFGSLTRRKGTLNVFDIISGLSEEIQKNTCFVFAGRIWDDLRDDFYQKYELLKDKTQIIVYDQFCTYEFFGSLCKSSDFIVLPYMNTSNSSGIISYGSLFGVPVIVPANGMVPKLVRKYKMGIVVKGDFVEEMVDIMPMLLKSTIISSDMYVKCHTIDEFSKVILS